MKRRRKRRQSSGNYLYSADVAACDSDVSKALGPKANAKYRGHKNKAKDITKVTRPRPKSRVKVNDKKKTEAKNYHKISVHSD